MAKPVTLGEHILIACVYNAARSFARGDDFRTQRSLIYFKVHSMFRTLAFFALLFGTQAVLAADTYDVVVYGGTSSGVIAAVQAAKLGKSVLLIEPGKHLGGLTSGGLGATDIGNKAAIGGLSREFYRRLGKHYGTPEAWTFEPHVAEKIYDDWCAETKVTVVRNQRLDLKSGVVKNGARIKTIAMESGRQYGGTMFIDATYEGDLIAKAGVKYAVGREANTQYGETLNGVQLGSKSHQFKSAVDPYIKPGDPNSGLLPGIHEGGAGEQGQGDKRVQAYNFRMCLTDVAENRLPFPKPDGYDPLRYELLLRYMKLGTFDALGSNKRMPGSKTDTNNNGGFSTDNIGMNYDYPDGDYATREKIFNEHVTYQQGLMWFLVNDPRVPAKYRDETAKWGLCKDEFTDSAGWPRQLYVREARRMISAYVMTQANCQGQTVADDAVGLAAYGMDSHNTQRYVKDGRVLNEGDVQVHGFTPYPISYRSIVPKADECENLLVPVCLSATHIAYGSIRMEPVFMVLGQSAATAACQAIDAKSSVQKIDVVKLHAKLAEDQQILTWTGKNAAASEGKSKIDLAKLPGIVLDDDQAELHGEWTASRATAGYVGKSYLHDNNANKGDRTATFTVKIPAAGQYDVRLAYPPLENRASNVPVTVSDGQQTKQITLNQRSSQHLDGAFTSVGQFRFEAGASVTVLISNAKTDGHVIVDAVQLVPAR